VLRVGDACRAASHMRAREVNGADRCANAGLLGPVRAGDVHGDVHGAAGGLWAAAHPRVGSESRATERQRKRERQWIALLARGRLDWSVNELNRSQLRVCRILDLRLCKY
jgi:hypothetical protein